MSNLSKAGYFLGIFIVYFVVAGSRRDYPIRVLGGGAKSFFPDVSQPPTGPVEAFDVVIVGGGLAGLTAAVYLTDHNKRVLLLEKEEHLGGIAAGGKQSGGVRYDRGAAYWTDAYEEEMEILEHIRLGNYERYAIAEPIDSYLWNGKLYEGIWEPHTLKKLPPSFALFKNELQKADKAGLIPNQPFEEFELEDENGKQKVNLDQYSAAQWIRDVMPKNAARRRDRQSKRIYSKYLRYIEDPKTPEGIKRDPMGSVILLMDLFCRSALGTTSEKVSAMAFANFYISEIDTRYTSDSGTGVAAYNMKQILEERKDYVRLKTLAPVGKIRQTERNVEVYYNEFVENKKIVRKAVGTYVVFAAQLNVAPKLIEGLSRHDKERFDLIQAISYAHYSVHAVEVKGHPYRVTYDTWTRSEDYSEDDFADLILGRWVELNGYRGSRRFESDPPGNSVFTLYHPLPEKWLGSDYSKTQAQSIAKFAVERMLTIYTPVLKEHWGTEIEVVDVESSMWPFSIHIARPGFYDPRHIRKLRKPLGRIYFAHSNLGTPAFEEALFRGHCAANNILTKLYSMSNTAYEQEEWSQCPLEN